MKIQATTRVVYEYNPLAEVVSQIRFMNIGEISKEEIENLLAEFSILGFTVHSEEVSYSIAHQFGPNGPLPVPVIGPQNRIHFFSSEDGTWRASVCSEFLALSCVSDQSWDVFYPKFLSLAKCFFANSTAVQPTRLGLRYKDVIEREPLGLEACAWHELIAPFLLGPLAPNSLADGQVAEESDVMNFLAQSQFKLDDAMLLLQSSLLTTADGERRAFLIDADFYHEGSIAQEVLSDYDLLLKQLESLHSNAGALFRRGITERLHDVLCRKS